MKHDLGYKALQAKRNGQGSHIKALNHTLVLKGGNLQVIDDHGIETFYVDKTVFKALGGIILVWGLTILFGVL